MYSSGRGEGLDFAVLGHPLRLRIVEVLTEWGPLSPSEMVNRRLCDDVPNVKGKTPKQQLRVVSYHCEKLETANWVTLRTEKRRGATKHIYSANAEALFPDGEWAALDKEEREAATNNVFQRFLAATQMSMQIGLFDERVDRVLGWGPLTLDERGWEELSEHMVAAFHVVEDKIRGEAEQRLTEPGAVALRATYGFFAFESPMPKFATE
jgi:hypothetical protein